MDIQKSGAGGLSFLEDQQGQCRELWPGKPEAEEKSARIITHQDR
jgi:hypothetical protein